jgi:hypothetical protein
LWSKQKDGPADVSGADENEFWKVAAATAVVTWLATDGFGGEGGGGFGIRLQESQRVHFDV